MPLNSWQFFLLSALAILLVPALRGGIRTTVFLALNLAFVWTYWGWAATPLAAAFLLLGYLAARLAPGRGAWMMSFSIATLTLAFLLLRGYGLPGDDVESRSGIALVSFAGLSFLFFKIVHVVIDASSGTIGRLSLSRYFNYCLNFTTVLMGPIQRFQDFTEQWEKEAATSLDFEAAVDAANRILRGLVKAFVVAPYLAPYILRSGLPIESMDTAELFLRTYGFYVFLYLDFSGYCDIVIGVGSLMGIRPPENFRFPFAARNVSAYWLQVHRSLTQWLTDYIFTPSYHFGLSLRTFANHGFLALAASLMLTMVIAGLWHGTTMSFLVFGLVHGVALIAMRGYDQAMTGWLGRARFRKFEAHPAIAGLALLVTFNFTSLAYVFFVLEVGEGMRVLTRLALSAKELLI